MFIPTYLTSFAKNSNIKDDVITCFDLIASNGKDKFIIEYYGDFLSDSKMIVQTDFAPQLVVAFEPTSGERIVLFDGTKHGYNAMFCDNYTDKQINSRPLTKFSDDLQSIKFEVFYGIDYLEEKDDFIDDNDEVALIDGEVIDFETLQNNGFDALVITLIDEHGKEFEIINEELA